MESVPTHPKAEVNENIYFTIMGDDVVLIMESTIELEVPLAVSGSIPIIVFRCHVNVVLTVALKPR